MLAAKMYGKKDIRIESVPIPVTGEGDVLIKVKAAAICGTDVRIWQNGNSGISRERPIVLGHEISGVIAEVGRNVKKYREGQRVAVAPNFGCGICCECVSGNAHLCRNYSAIGINLDGGFAEYVRVPARAVDSGNITIIDDSVSFEAAAVNEPLSCAYNGHERCGVKPGEAVLIIGAGPIGIMHAMLAEMAGAGKIIINDLSQERLEACKTADRRFIPVSGDVKAFIEDITGGRGADVCITACPSPAAQKTATEICAINGRINFFGGIPASKEPVSIDTNLIHYKQLMISGTTRSSLIQFRKTLGFISSGMLDIENVITDRYGITDINEAFSNAEQAKGLKHVICYD